MCGGPTEFCQICGTKNEYNEADMKNKIIESNPVVIPDRSNEIIIKGENCHLEILSIGTDPHGRRHILLKSHPFEKSASACAQEKRGINESD